MGLFHMGLFIMGLFSSKDGSLILILSHVKPFNRWNVFRRINSKYEFEI